MAYLSKRLTNEVSGTRATARRSGDEDDDSDAEVEGVLDEGRGNNPRRLYATAVSPVYQARVDSLDVQARHNAEHVARAQEEAVARKRDIKVHWFFSVSSSLACSSVAGLSSWFLESARQRHYTDSTDS